MNTKINPGINRSRPSDGALVKVTYPDGKNEHITTVADLKERFKDETPVWLTGFINSILGDGVGFTKFGRYDLIIE